MNGYLDIRNLTLRLKTGVPILRSVSLTVKAGQVHGLVGESGAGKSTLLQCIAGYRSLDKGSCIVKSGARMGEFLEE